ncbi:MAG: LysR family transcriptional regulator [Bulleidia sp.]|nr:LysR family transcriptional regulator [Bulleidia sp.]
MDIKQLKTFAVLAKEKNYIKAGEVLNYAPSTLAKHVHALENEFNTTLVEFSNGSIQLTPQGTKFLEYALEMLKVYDACATEFETNTDRNKILVAGGELMVAFSFGPFFQNYQKDLGHVSVEINTICCSKVPKWLDAHECDIGYVQMVDMSESEGAKVIPLFQEKLCVMASPDHPLVHQERVCLADFEGFSFTYTYSECCFTDLFRKQLKQAGIQLESELFLGSVTAVVDSCLKRNNLCLIPYVAIDKIKELGLVPLHWVDSFNIFDCILTKNPVQKNDGLYPLLQATKTYCQHLKQEEHTKNIVLL